MCPAKDHGTGRFLYDHLFIRERVESEPRRISKFFVTRPPEKVLVQKEKNVS